MGNAFSIRESIKSGWKLINNDNLFLLIGLILGYLVIYGVLYIPFLLGGGVTMIISGILLFIFQITFPLGFIKTNLLISKGEEPEIGSILPKAIEIGRFFVTSILFYLPMFISSYLVTLVSNIYIEAMLHVPTEQVMAFMVMFINKHNLLTVFLPVIIFNILCLISIVLIQVRWMLFPFYIVDKKAGIIDSLRLSWTATKGNSWHLFLLGLTCIGMIILGVMALILGVLVVVPVMSMATVLVYQQLDKAIQPKEVIEPIQPEIQ